MPRFLVTRRTVAGLAAGGLSLALLAGCGFHLRQPQALQYQRIALSGFAPRSTMAEEIRRALPEGTTLVGTVAQAQVIVDAVEDLRESTVEASTSSAQVRELRLHVRLRYRVVRADGHVLLAEKLIERERDLTYDETDALAKDAETTALYRDMQSDIATQLVRVLATLSRSDAGPVVVGAAAAPSGPASATASAPASR